jgi:polysaccharide pyruvyl transferase WcaK-like protein
MKKGENKVKKVSLFGHFGMNNFGNESTLQAIIYHLRKFAPNAEITCICTNPDVTAITYNIAAIPIDGVIVKPWTLRNPLARLVRKVCIGIPSELYRWFRGFVMLMDTDMLIVPGTGLLTDAYGLVNWGPYSMFKWALTAKLCRCKLLFVSVGAGPIYGVLGRCLVKLALSMADFRSYRDESTLQYIKSIGLQPNNDKVYPDLAFSLPEAAIPPDDVKKGPRRVVGLGLMEYAGKYSVKDPSSATYVHYLETLVTFVRWLLAHEYDVRLLIGDVRDRQVTDEFITLLKERLLWDEVRIIDTPVLSVADLLSQLTATDIVVATRFHNVLLALLLNRPAISISFHHKCVSLMRQMGLSEYCQDINSLDADSLIEQLCDMEKNAEKLKPLIRNCAEKCRVALDEQYSCIFKDMFADCPPMKGISSAQLLTNEFESRSKLTP